MMKALKLLSNSRVKTKLPQLIKFPKRFIKYPTWTPPSSRRPTNSPLDSQGLPRNPTQGLNIRSNSPLDMGATQKPLKVQFDPDQVSFQSDKKFTQVVLFTSGLILFACFIASNYITMKKQAKKKASPNNAQIGRVSYTGQADIGGPWALYDTKGNIFTHRKLQGKYYLIYFGFTLCPDVCPISLFKIAKALKKIKKSKEYKYFDIQSVFVSVDPDRDTNQRIRQYCKIFDENMIGLTHKSNDNPELKEIMRKFKIYSSKIYLSAQDQKEDQKNLNQNAPEVMEKMGKLTTKKNQKYTLDHTIVTYLMGPNNQFLTYLGSNLNQNQMAEIIIDQVSSDLSSKYIGSKSGPPKIKQI